MLRPLAAAIVANMVEGTFGFLEESAMRKLLMVPGIPGIAGGGKECNEPANMAAAAAAVAFETALSPAEDEEDTLYPLVDVLTSRPFSEAVDERTELWLLL